MKIKVEVSGTFHENTVTKTAEIEFATNDSTSEIEKLGEFTETVVKRLVLALKPVQCTSAD